MRASIVTALVLALAGCGSSATTPDGGTCAPSNGGVETCDGLDNDCNGVIDDVDPALLAADPNHCGACATACDYTSTHQLGACSNGACAPAGCVPGWSDADGDPGNGCESGCTPAPESCNGIDDDCDGRIDNGFTATWAADGTPNYDSDAANCGGCGLACDLPGAVSSCAAGSGGRGACAVDHCINDPGVATYRHDPASGALDTTGCEYRCPTPSSTAGDCDAGACTFPVETCNGVDDDCDFAIDDHVTDPGIGQPCGDACPGGLVANCVGQCKAGTLACDRGIATCSGNIGPSAEVCDGADNDCDGSVDEDFTAPAPAGFANGDLQHPLYNSDAHNCGGCGPDPRYVCALPHATDGCHSASANAQGNCFVASCDAGFNYAAHTDSDVAAPSCNVVSAARDSTPGNAASGVGCFYQCSHGFAPPLTTCSGCTIAASESTCDGQDNNCDGCIDNIATKPTGLCATAGVCAGAAIPISCKGVSGWKCDYSGVANVELDGSGNLATVEARCDGLDNNCDGFCDESFPGVPTGPAPGCQRNPNRAATSCSAGNGPCLKTGTLCCGTTAGTCAASAAGSVCNVSADLTKAQPETCNGIDDNCNGLVDDPNSANGKAGYHDPTVQVSVPAGDPSLFGNPAAHTVYIYSYEAARPDSSATSPGAIEARACAKSGVVPWSLVTESEARAACAGAGGRLCTSWEWQTVCEGPTTVPPPSWSFSTTQDVYVAGACNDANRATPPALWTTGHGPNSGTKTCSVIWPGGSVADLSGNLFEWTRTPTPGTVLGNGAGASVGSSGTAGQMQVSGLAGLVTAGVTAGDTITLSGSTASNGTFEILTVVDGATLIVAKAGFPASGGTDATNGAIGWSVFDTVYPTRGGSYSSQPAGATCEFDAITEEPGFVSDDLGFRCCFDSPP